MKKPFVVYLAWVNDMLLGVYKDKDAGIAAITEYLETNFKGEWKLIEGKGWKNTENSTRIARLQVEVWPIIGATRSVR